MMDSIRQDFHTWAKTTHLCNHLFWDAGAGVYVVFPVQQAWLAWQAAIAHSAGESK